MDILGIDIGGSGIKAAVVNVEKGTLVSERHRIPTPKPAKPEVVAQVVYEMLGHFRWKDAVGVSFPTVIVDGKSLTKGNIDSTWRDCQVDALFAQRCGHPFSIINIGTYPYAFTCTSVYFISAYRKMLRGKALNESIRRLGNSL